jgi:hypothetical protein
MYVEQTKSKEGQLSSPNTPRKGGASIPARDVRRLEFLSGVEFVDACVTLNQMTTCVHFVFTTVSFVLVTKILDTFVDWFVIDRENTHNTITST